MDNSGGTQVVVWEVEASGGKEEDAEGGRWREAVEVGKVEAGGVKVIHPVWVGSLHWLLSARLSAPLAV